MAYIVKVREPGGEVVELYADEAQQALDLAAQNRSGDRQVWIEDDKGHVVTREDMPHAARARGDLGRSEE